MAMIKKYRPQVLAGVPTLFEALTTNEKLKDFNFNFENEVSGGIDHMKKWKNWKKNGLQR